MSEIARTIDAITVRSEAERDAYMAGQSAALKLAREKGIDYAERIIALAQSTVRPVARRGQPNDLSVSG